MNCGFCVEALSGLTGGLIALVSFIFFPVMQVVFAFFGLIIDKIIALSFPRRRESN